MSEAEFDRHAAKYREVHAANITASGEAPEYFADYKMRDFAAMARACNAPSQGRYLDFGCGVGNSVAPFREHLPNAQLVAADVSEGSLARLREVFGDAVETLLVSSDALPLPSGSLDGAFACCVFHHIPPENHVMILKDLRRVLRPGAPLMVYEHNPMNPLTVRAVNTCPLDENAILIRADEMRSRFAEAGFGGISHHYRVFFPAFLRHLRPLENQLRKVPLGAQYFVLGYA
jgi:SAM-dependent methyltransferase